MKNNKRFSDMIKMITVLFLLSLSAKADINAIEYGFIPNDDTFDNSVILNQFVINVGADRTLHFPVGDFYFNSKPNVINKNITIRGEHVNGTTLCRNYTPNGYSDALIHSKSVIVIERVGILATGNTAGGGAIRLEGISASASVLRDLYITARPGSNYEVTLALVSNDSLGIRGVLIDNVELFAATMHIAWFVNVRGLTANFQAYPAGGTSHQVVLQGSSGYRSKAVVIRTRHINQLWIYDSDSVKVDTLGTAVTSSNSTGVKVI